MTVESMDEDGNEFIFRASQGVAKFRMDDDFKTEKMRNMAIVLIRRRAAELGMPLIDMEEVQEAVAEIPEEKINRMDEGDSYPVEVEDKVTQDPLKIGIKVQKITAKGEHDDPAFFEHEVGGEE